jgi:hypothetical protein
MAPQMTTDITTHAPTQLMAFAEKQAMAEAVAKSGLFGLKSADQALALMGLCEATGLHPMRAAQDYHIIQGRPALTADAMLARFQAAGGRVRWTVYTDDAVEGQFSHPAGGEIVVRWDLARAKKAGLTNANWQKFPRQMMRARCCSEAIRAILPGIVSGSYTPEEVAEMPPSPPAPEPVDPMPALRQRMLAKLEELGIAISNEVESAAETASSQAELTAAFNNIVKAFENPQLEDGDACMG